ncbi:hypothetical protein BE20_01615 [Sorangium cellulosum]|uniref:Uncharacterized protein n=1 Tax=Sorangium cellulosum TaxID=56 RepID=A0A150SIS2_SORCE|nr:hypothetical protein BE18_06570 [Sorangium cellulosum]KYF92237.1 hypothetical protein BE20_01615 [Sorangium cellulosum]
MDPTEPLYFRVERSPAKRAGTQWRATATIVRDDTGEPVERLTARASTAGAAEEQLDAAIEGALAGLEKPPRDWGRDPTVFRLLRRYLQLRDEVYGMLERASAAAEPDALTLRRDAEAYEQGEMRKLEEQVEALTDAQWIELSTPTEDQLARLDDAWVLDMLTAKKRLCQLASRRPHVAQSGYEQLEQALDG